MNAKISGGQSVIVPIKRLGNNTLPFVENLKDRVIKYIDVDVVNPILPDGSTNALQPNYNTEAASTYITLVDKNGVVINYNNYPVFNLISYMAGTDRNLIGKKLSLQNSFITITNPYLIGQSVLLTFWYDEPEFSQRNTTNNISVETIEVAYLSATKKNLMPDNRTLAGKRVRRILFDYATITPSYKDCVNTTKQAQGYITLNNGNTSILKQVPIASLYKYGVLNTFDLEFANIKFDLTNSWIETFGDNAFVPNQAWLIRFAYEN